MPTTFNSSQRRCKLYYDLMASTIRAQGQACTPLDFYDYIRTEAYNNAITDVLHKIERSPDDDDKDKLIINVSGMKKRFHQSVDEDDPSPFLKSAKIYSSIRRTLFEKRMWKE